MELSNYFDIATSGLIAGLGLGTLVSLVRYVIAFLAGLLTKI